MEVQTKRIHDPIEPTDGLRVLVDGLWPRGVRKEAASWDLWLRPVAPSATLRRWFAHDPSRWDEFRRRYRDELHASGELTRLREVVTAHGRMTLVYSARDRQHNQAVALRELLLEAREGR